MPFCLMEQSFVADLFAFHEQRKRSLTDIKTSCYILDSIQGGYCLSVFHAIAGHMNHTQLDVRLRGDVVDRILRCLSHHPCREFQL